MILFFHSLYNQFIFPYCCWYSTYSVIYLFIHLLKKLIVSEAFTATKILKLVILSFVLFLEVFLGERNWSANFLVKAIGKLLEQYFLVNLEPPNLVVSWVRVSDSHSQSHMFLWSCGHVMSHDKIKTLYLYFHKTCKHHTWHSSDLGWGASTHQWSHGHMMSRVLSSLWRGLLPTNLAAKVLRVVTWGQMPSQKSCISSSTKLMAIKLSRVEV